MPGKILVAYASKTNATAQHAGAVAGALKSVGRNVEIVNLREGGKPDLAGYDIVVIGSGIRIGRWYGPAKKLLKRKELVGKKVALFVACGMMAEDSSKQEEAVRDYIEKIAAKHNVKYACCRAFVGFMPDGKSMKLGSASDSNPVDTAASVEWGKELAKLL
ncbi:MAG: flavodoxin domain-containing protein [Thermoplasmata archaeon]